MEETHERQLEIQILERVEDSDSTLHPRLVLDDAWRTCFLGVPPAMAGRDDDWTWVMGLLDNSRLSNIFHLN